MSVVQLAAGISTGYGFSQAAQKEAEVRQGKNYYQSALFQAAQISQLNTILWALSNAIPNPCARVGAKVAGMLTSSTGVLACPVSAIVRQNHFEKVSKILKSALSVNHPRIAGLVPDKLGSKSEKRFSYLAEHLGTMTTKVMAVGSIGLLMTGNVYLPLGMMLPIGFGVISRRGWMPKQVDLLVERHMPMFGTISGLLGGGPIARMISGLSLLTYLPSFNQFLHKKIDKLAIQQLGLSGPSIEQIDGPLVVTKQLSFKEINAILDAKRDEFAVNPAHCSKSIASFISLPKNDDFDQFFELFKSINWEDRYSLLLPAFLDDDRFIDYLKVQFPTAQDTQDRGESYIEELAKQEKCTKEHFLARQLEKQIRELIKMLKSERRAPGSLEDAEESIQYCAQILAYLLGLTPDNPLHRVIIEDTLLKLGIEGGEYCARGVKRASREIVTGILQELRGIEADPIQNYECRLRQALETERMRLVTSRYQYFIAAAVSAMKGTELQDIATPVTDVHAVAAAQDIHTLDLYRKIISLGVIPMTTSERNSMGLSELYLWADPTYPFRSFRIDMYREYYERIDGLIKELGLLDFATYIRAVIEQNDLLGADQKDAILEKFTERNLDTWSVEETQSRFNRLVCVMLGILNYEEGWVEVAPEETPTVLASSVSSPSEQEALDADWVLV